MLKLTWFDKCRYSELINGDLFFCDKDLKIYIKIVSIENRNINALEIGDAVSTPTTLGNSTKCFKPDCQVRPIFSSLETLTGQKTIFGNIFHLDCFQYYGLIFLRVDFGRENGLNLENGKLYNFGDAVPVVECEVTFKLR